MARSWPEEAVRIQQWLQQHHREMVDLLVALAELETPSLDSASQERALSLLRTEYEQLQFRARLLKGGRSGGQLWAVGPGHRRGTPLQLVIGHCDTVWPVGTLQKMPVRIEDDRLRGPGVYDMKFGLTQALFAFKALAALDLPPAWTPCVFINSDEEIGSPDSERRIRLLARRVKRVFITEPTLGEEGRLKTARKGIGGFQIRIDGKASHAGLAPEEGISAIREMAYVIDELDRLNDPQRGISVNVGQVSGGTRPNVVAAHCEAAADVRVPTGEDAARIEAAIRNLRARRQGAKISVQGGIAKAPMERTPRNRELWRLAREAAQMVGFDLKEGSVGGGSDGNLTSLYTATLDGMGAVGGGAHADHEFIFLDRMVERTAFLALLLLAEKEFG